MGKPLAMRRLLTLLVLGLAEGEELSPVQMQKSVFLLQKRLTGILNHNDQYEFIPYSYGPFSAQIYKDAKQLAEEGFAIVNTRENGNQSYMANVPGIKRTLRLLADLEPEKAKLAQEIVSWVKAQSFRSLVSAIYEEYPEYRVNSIFRD